MRTYFPKLTCLFTAVLLLFSTISLAQNQQPPAATGSQSSADTDSPLAAAARDAKSKKVFTDDDMETTAGPLPRLKMEGAENADEIVVAISKYKTTHTPEQTEQAVHIWYDRYDQLLAAAIQDNQDIATLCSANMSNGYALCQESQDYEQCRSRQMAEMRGAQSDQTQVTKNNSLEVRIQHSFMKVRNGLQANSLHYDWFKIRTTNNIDQF